MIHDSRTLLFLLFGSGLSRLGINMHAKRSVRVAELLKREISQILIKEINDPLISLVTISTVKMTDDLKYAKIYFTVLGDKENRVRVSERLERATKFIKNLIGNRLKLRYVPEL